MGLAPTASAQDALNLFPTGAEAKAHAGAGQLASREAPANYYNPANLIESKGMVTGYAELGILSLTYTYSYEGFDAVEVSKTTPLPFFGGTVKPLPALSIAVSLLPLPASSSEQKTENVPSREITAEPITVDAETKGTGLGYRLSLGAAYRFLETFGVGLSVVSSHSETRLTAYSHNDGMTLIETDKDTTTTQIILGLRGVALKGRATGALTLRLPSSTKTTGETRIKLIGDATTDASSETEGPLGIGFGIAGRVFGGLSPFFEVLYQGYEGIEETAKVGLEEGAVAYQNTLDIGLGADFAWRGQTFTAALGLYDSPLADGVMKERADDGKELVGMKVQDVDKMPRKNLAGGWARSFLKGRLRVQSGLSYVFGSRSVAENARGYGDYDLTIVTLIAGAAYRL